MFRLALSGAKERGCRLLEGTDAEEAEACTRSRTVRGMSREYSASLVLQVEVEG